MSEFSPNTNLGEKQQYFLNKTPLAGALQTFLSQKSFKNPVAKVILSHFE